MENVPISVRLCRTMDVLMKFDKVPPKLRHLSKESISNLIIRALWKNQLHSEASSTAAASVRILSTVEENLRFWVKYLPAAIREEILINTAKLLISNLGTVGYRSQHHTYNPLPVLIASCFEILYDVNFKNLVIFNELQWNNESRGKVLHLLHKNLNTGVQNIDFACYKSPAYGLTTVPFSEKFILASCFNRLPNLKSLQLCNVADDDIIAKIADCCPFLEDLNVSGSFGVTNLGVQWFCTGTYNPDHLYHHHGSHLESNNKVLPDNRQFMLKNTGSRIGFQPTPILQIGQPISSRPVVKGEILKSLKRANFTGTSVDSKALELLLSHCKNLQKMIMDDEVWNNFFNLFEIDDERGGISVGCIDCVGPSPKMVEINMATNVSFHLDSVLFLFPNLINLTFNKPLNTAKPECITNLTMFLSDFVNQSRLTLKDVHFDHMTPFLGEDLGSRLTHLFFSGKSTLINIDHLNAACPNLQSLVITHSTLTMDQTMDATSNNKIMYKNLNFCRLYDIHVDQSNDHAWKKLLKSAKNLTHLYLFNIVIADMDIEDLMNFNKLVHLQDIRIGCSEIGFVKLTDDTVTRLVRSCSDLKSIGGICDWKIRDLLTLLTSLMQEGGWKITLENNHQSSTT